MNAAIYGSNGSKMNVLSKLWLASVFSLLPSYLYSAEVNGELKQWHTITLAFTGPHADEQAEENPFVDYDLSVRLVHRNSSQEMNVLGFFAADGKAAETSATAGNQWQVRFCPPKTGYWDYSATLRLNGREMELVGAKGSFFIAESDKSGADFRAQGLLECVGERYLKFAGSGKYFLKAGTDSPETLLGYHDFDGTWHDTKTHSFVAPQNPIQLPSLEQGLHRFTDHLRDWNDGDPTWQGGKGKGLIGGLNYLAEIGVNSVYFLTMNVHGDGRNVWPWTEPVAFDRFDVTKLDQWEIVFEHMQKLGLQLHVVLQETENDHLLDDGQLGPNRKRYLREMVARFAHHPAIVWNLGEENLQTVEQQQAMAAFIRSIDPYQHPIVIHNDHWAAKNLRDTFDPHLGTDTLDGTSIQDFNWNDIHGHVLHYVEASKQAGKPWVVCTDEMGGADFGLKTDEQDPDHDIPRSKGLWGNLMAGGAGVEWYFGWQNNSPHSDFSAETWRTREAMFRQTRIAIDFFNRYLPYNRMESADELTMASDDYCLALPGEIYCVYLPRGGNTRLNLIDEAGCYLVSWFNPRTGGELQTGSVRIMHGGRWEFIGAPPNDDGGDWVALIRRTEPIYTANTKGLIVVEAEHFSKQELDAIRRWYVFEKTGPLPDLAGAGEPTTWVRSIHSAASKASGSQFVRLLPDTRVTHDDPLIDGENFMNEPGKSAILSYSVHFPHAGRYFVWVRAFSTGTEDNSIHVGMDGDWPTSGQRMQWCEGKGQWTWACAQRTDKNHCGEPMQIYLDVSQPGLHAIQFSMREDGFAFDKFLLTQDIDYRPKGNDASETLWVQPE